MDWQNSKFVQQSKSLNDKSYNKVAESCCKTPSNLCAIRDHPSNINIRVCALAIESQVADHLFLISILSLVICLFQSIGVLLGGLLVSKINRKKQYESINNSNDNWTFFLDNYSCKIGVSNLYSSLRNSLINSNHNLFITFLIKL